MATLGLNRKGVKESFILFSRKKREGHENKSQLNVNTVAWTVFVDADARLAAQEGYAKTALFFPEAK